ncbi:MAG: glycosyltransferase [Halioglobus sp.]|nr:glycosyltransferase [Halioglobus sp.]
MKNYSVCAGIVAHNPKAVDINTLIESLLSCARWVVVVDNSSADTSYLKDLELRPEVKIICNAKNRGVSGGINQIIEYAREMNAEYVTAYDQDTQISDDLVSILAADLQKLIESGERVAGIGPLVIDDFTNNTLPFVLFRLPFNARYSGKARAKEDCVVECSFLISSGCLMSMKAVEEIGAMNESLFIDNVDLDWCFRAADKRYKVYGNFAGVIRQRIGENCTQIPFTNSVIRYHDFNRNYYMTRNRFWLYRQAYAKSSWVLHDVCRFASKLLYLLVFRKGRITLLKSSAKGVLDSFAVQSYEESSL